VGRAAEDVNVSGGTAILSSPSKVPPVKLCGRSDGGIFKCGLEARYEGSALSLRVRGWFRICEFISEAGSSGPGVKRESVSSSVGGDNISFAVWKAGAAAMAKPKVLERTAIAMRERMRRASERWGAGSGFGGGRVEDMDGSLAELWSLC